jgi:hypothetical protein
MQISQPGPNNFLELGDTPDSYFGQGGKMVAVKSIATGLEFVASGASANIATEIVSATQSGVDVTINLTSLSHTLSAIQIVFRNGQGLTPTSDYSITGNTLTIFSANAAEIFMIQYTY